MHLVSSVVRFARNRQGAYAIMYALAAAPVMLGMGLAIDYRNAQLAMAELQEALDSALLASTRKFSEAAGKSDSERAALAEAAGRTVFQENLTGSSVDADPLDIQFIFDGAQVKVKASVKGKTDLLFDNLFGMQTLNLSAQGAAQGADRRRVEVVLALDNTGSMTSKSGSTNESRMRLMRAAAHNFVDYLFDYGLKDNLYVGIVPWSNTVNIAFETPADTWNDAAWLQNENLKDSGTGVNSWPAPTSSFMDTYLVMPQEHRLFTKRGGQKLTAAPLTSPTGLQPPSANDISPRDNLDDALGIAGPGFDFAGDQSYSSNTNKDLLNDAFSGNPWRGCIRAADNERKNDNSRNVTQALTDDVPAGGLLWQPYVLEQGVSGYGGDNQPSCASPMLPLSGNRGQIKQTLERMRADGNTYQDIGLTWALRMLSPRQEWVSFFRYGSMNRPAAFNVSATRKVVVLLTDGENVASGNREQYYGCDQNQSENSENVRNFNNKDGSSSWGRRNGAGGCWRAKGLSRIDNEALDNLLLDSCKQLRSVYRVELYTIAVDITNDDAIDLLNKCAGGSDAYIHPRFENISGSEINSVLLAIAQESLRLVE